MQTRYDRQIIISEIGEKGQEKLRKSEVLLIGFGGLGTPCATYLAQAGIGRLEIIDADTVAFSNLNRQFFFTEQDIDLYKNPNFIVTFPEYVENVEITNLAVANAEEIFTTDETIEDANYIEQETLDTKEAVLMNILIAKPMKMVAEGVSFESDEPQDESKDETGIHPAFAKLKDLL